MLSVTGLHELRLRYRPMRRVGVMVPGGSAAYPSTLLMTICPAQAAGVKELAVVMPPTPKRQLLRKGRLLSPGKVRVKPRHVPYTATPIVICRPM